MRSRPVILFTALSVLTVGLFLLDLAVGAVRIPVGDVWAALTGGDCPRTTAKIVLNIRLIKAVVALLAGAALSVSGLQMQLMQFQICTQISDSFVDITGIFANQIVANNSVYRNTDVFFFQKKRALSNANKSAICANFYN